MAIGKCTQPSARARLPRTIHSNFRRWQIIPSSNPKLRCSYRAYVGSSFEEFPLYVDEASFLVEVTGTQKQFQKVADTLDQEALTEKVVEKK